MTFDRVEFLPNPPKLDRSGSDFDLSEFCEPLSDDPSTVEICVQDAMAEALEKLRRNPTGTLYLYVGDSIEATITGMKS